LRPQPTISLSDLSSRAGFGSVSIKRALSNRRAASSASSSAGEHTSHSGHTGSASGLAASALVGAAGTRNNGSGSSDPLRRSLLRWRSSSSAPQDRTHSSAPSSSSGLNASAASSSSMAPSSSSSFPADDVSALLIEAVFGGLVIEETRALVAAHEVMLRRIKSTERMG
jgi:hypothetical protein